MTSPVRVNPLLSLASLQYCERVAGQIESDDTPALQIWVNSEGMPTAGNQTTRRFSATRTVASWESIVFAADLERWDDVLNTSILEQTLLSGCFRLRRFDNAIRHFVIRGEPRFDGRGAYAGHLLAGLEVNEMTVNQLAVVPRNPNGNSDVVKRQALEWHDQLVSAATVICTSADIISTSLAVDSDADGSLIEVLRKLTAGCDALRSGIRMLSERSRSSSSLHT